MSIKNTKDTPDKPSHYIMRTQHSRVNRKAMPKMKAAFGYGSLMNRSTLPYELTLRPASVHGWVRQWRNPFVMNGIHMCFLTVQPRPDFTIPGVLLSDGPQEYDHFLMERESPDVFVTVACVVTHNFRIDANMSVASDENLFWASAEAPIFLSYLDCVLQGCLQLYGRAGVVEFLANTEGWHLPLVNDRAQPNYNRSVTLNRHEADLIDSCLVAHKFL